MLSRVGVYGTPPSYTNPFSADNFEVPESTSFVQERYRNSDLSNITIPCLHSIEEQKVTRRDQYYTFGRVRTEEAKY